MKQIQTTDVRDAVSGAIMKSSMIWCMDLPETAEVCLGESSLQRCAKVREHVQRCEEESCS